MKADCKDTDRLIERLRDYLFLKMSHPHFGNVADDCKEAADALEASQERIVALEERVRWAEANRLRSIEIPCKKCAESDQRIAELEADLEAQEQVAITWMEMANDKDERIEQLVEQYGELAAIGIEQAKRIEQLEAALREAIDLLKQGSSRFAEIGDTFMQAGMLNVSEDLEQALGEKE